MKDLVTALVILGVGFISLFVLYLGIDFIASQPAVLKVIVG